MTDKPYSEYAERNGAPILSVLQGEFANCTRVLEIGSGTGQHAAQFAKALPFLQWQTSDRDENLGGINAWVKDSGLSNLLPPLSMDVLIADVAAASCDAVFSANTAHIMSIEAVQKMFALVGKALSDGGVFCLYGPFRQGGDFNTPSNAAFHKTLRSRNSEMGIRHLESLDGYARDHDMDRVRLYAMPANNHIAVWHKVAV
jgi:SAM-dependent methyltransferase